MATKARANPVATTLDLGGAVAAAGGGAKGLYRDGDSKACVAPTAPPPRRPPPAARERSGAAPRARAKRRCCARRAAAGPNAAAALPLPSLSHPLPRASLLRRPKSNNIMYDKRVVRGSTYAMPVIPHVSPRAARARNSRGRAHST